MRFVLAAVLFVFAAQAPALSWEECRQYGMGPTACAKCERGEVGSCSEAWLKERERRAQELAQARARSNTTREPSRITNCDSAGCWDNLGGRYNRGAGTTYFGPGGSACQLVGNMMRCP